MENTKNLKSLMILRKKKLKNNLCKFTNDKNNTSNNKTSNSIKINITA
jgi:hypothetical protein